MSKKHDKPKASLPPAKPIESKAEQPTREIESYRRCPLCWEGNGGYGSAYSTHGRTRYYKCKSATTERGPCGHTWTATVKIEVVKVEHRRVQLDGER